MNEPRHWVTYAQAALITGRSKRTLRRWVSDPDNSIDTRKDVDGGITLNAADLRRVEADKTEYRATPTFGRH